MDRDVHRAKRTDRCRKRTETVTADKVGLGYAGTKRIYVGELFKKRKLYRKLPGYAV